MLYIFPLQKGEYDPVASGYLQFNNHFSVRETAMGIF
jgi:hypothetical protein